MDIEGPGTGKIFPDGIALHSRGQASIPLCKMRKPSECLNLLRCYTNLCTGGVSDKGKMIEQTWKFLSMKGVFTEYQ